MAASSFQELKTVQFSPLKRTEKQEGRSLLFLTFLLGVLLLATALPAARARLQLLWGDDTRAAIAEGREVPTKDLALLLASRARVASNGFGFHSDVVYNEMAIARLQAAQNKDIPSSEIKPLLAEALAEQKTALSIAPADTYGWARYAFLAVLNEGLSADAIAALKLEIETAPYEPALMMARLGLALSLYDKMDPAMRKQTDDQLRVTWKHYPSEVEALARDTRKSQLLEQALRNDPQTNLWLGGRSLGQP